LILKNEMMLKMYGMKNARQKKETGPFRWM